MQKTNFKTRLLALLTAAFMHRHVRSVCSTCRCPDMVAVDLVWDKDQVEVTRIWVALLMTMVMFGLL